MNEKLNVRLGQSGCDVFLASAMLLTGIVVGAPLASIAAAHGRDALAAGAFHDGA